MWFWGLPNGSDGKESVSNAEDPGSIPGSGRFPWRRKWQPTPVFLPGESHGQRSLVGCSPWGSKSRTWLSNQPTRGRQKYAGNRHHVSDVTIKPQWQRHMEGSSTLKSSSTGDTIPELCSKRACFTGEWHDHQTHVSFSI